MSLFYGSEQKNRSWQEMADFWQQKYEEYVEWSNKAPKWDSQDSMDHQYRPEDPQVGLSRSPHKKGNKISVLHICILQLRGQQSLLSHSTVPAG